MYRLDRRTVVVAGGVGGIGSAACLRFGVEGARAGFKPDSREVAK